MALGAATVAASRLKDAEITSSSAAAQYIADGCLVDAPLGRVGLEMEAHCFDPLDPYRRPNWEEITEVREQLPAMPGGSAVTVEPGGAIELSGQPEGGIAAAIGSMANDQAVLRNACAEAGLGLVYLGADPLRTPKRVNPGARYVAMEDFFTSSDSEAAGARMMTSTASIQVNVDAGPQAGWAARVRLAHALGPTMIAIAANSPMIGGEFTGWVSTRQRVWGQMDSARCGPILGAAGDDPGTDWARYALKAPVMMLNNPDASKTSAVTHWVPFADWADGRTLLGGRRPTIADLEYHLTTLFPPVRPRQWLEIAAEAVEPVATAWDIAAQLGLRDRRLHEAAIRCVVAAAEKAPAELTDAMDRLVRAVEQGRCPGDCFSDQVIEHGIAASVSEAADTSRLSRGGL
jgi:glutamate--cysteine ligase